MLPFAAASLLATQCSLSTWFWICFLLFSLSSSSCSPSSTVLFLHHLFLFFLFFFIFGTYQCIKS
ncbi:unnamed protein product [Musa acuminata subsp. burmannicoides]